MPLKHTLLGFLNYQAMTGYELKKMMDVSTSNFWHAKQSQIYTTLKRLDEAKWVESAVEVQVGRPDRRIYTITEAGRAALRVWLAQPLTDLQPKKDLLLLKLFFSASVDQQIVLTQLRIQRDLHQQLATRYKNDTKAVIQAFAEQSGLQQDAIFWDATRRYGEMIEETTLRWLDETIALLEENGEGAQNDDGKI